MGAIVSAPVIINVGKASRSNIRDLKNGCGELLTDVQEALDEVTTSLGADADGKHLIPVILLYRKKSKSKSGQGSLLPIKLPLLS